MNTQQLQRALSNNIHTRDTYLGVFASDQLPERITKYPACFIANVDPATKSGSHWVAFYIKSRYVIEFFDSYGHPPSYFPRNISTYVTHYRRVSYNPMVLQSNVTAVCGQYCVYYLYSKCKGRTLNSILLSFIPGNLYNDIKVYNFVTKYFNVRTQFYQ